MPRPHRHLEGAAAGEVGMASSFTKLRGEWNAWAAAELRKGFGGSARAMRFLGDGAEARGGAEFEETGGGGRRGARPQKRGDSRANRTGGQRGPRTGAGERVGDVGFRGHSKSWDLLGVASVFSVKEGPWSPSENR